MEACEHLRVLAARAMRVDAAITSLLYIGLWMSAEAMFELADRVDPRVTTKKGR